MLKLDRFSENVLFECDRCRRVGELFADLVEEEGHFLCWNCLSELNFPGNGQGQGKKYAVK